ncbi:LexA family protein [Mycobacteroides abscessus]|uniref:LexA family protein n=1 Tax=Mycobacteroides abscessus TaxID=36809 RepID=UPI0002585736|nr:SOS-response transcriptional repressor, LexA [Mycobacteroides abscessus M94]
MRVQEKAVLNFLTDYVGEHGYAPSYREICEGTGIRSSSSIQPVLDSLQDEGFIRHRARVSRAIALLR